ncbi:MAG: hypothetical protein V1856_00460 [Candidatus Liptonbacteria bacterium]
MRQCSKCGKGSIIRGSRKLLRGHYNPTGTSRKYPNLQYAKMDGSRKLVCVQCIKSMGKPARKIAPKKPKKKAT